MLLKKELIQREYARARNFRFLVENIIELSKTCFPLTFEVVY